MVHRILQIIASNLGLALLLIGASALPSQASAADVLFTVTGGATASFVIDQSPIPSTVGFNDFGIGPFSGTFQGTPDEILSANFSNNGLGFTLFLDSSNNFLGLQPISSFEEMFSGPLTSPIFNIGTYDFSGLLNNEASIDFTVNISEAPAVPEPSTWMMLVAGFGMIGGAMRYGRRMKAVDFATACVGRGR
jgi:hypothetical protein